MGRVSQLLRLLVALAGEERVLDHDDVVGHPCHLLDRVADVGEVVGRDPGDDAIERAVGER